MAFQIDPATKTQLLQQRIEQLNLEGYNHELNLKTGEAIGNTQMVEEAQISIAIIIKAIEVAQAELDL